MSTNPGIVKCAAYISVNQYIINGLFSKNQDYIHHFKKKTFQFSFGPNRDLCIRHEPVKIDVNPCLYMFWECKNVKTEMIQAGFFNKS